MVLRIPTRRQPVTLTDPAELILALRARHMIASLILFYADRALRAFLADLVDLSGRRSFGSPGLRTRHAVVVFGAGFAVVPCGVVSRALHEVASEADHDLGSIVVELAAGTTGA